MADNKKYYYLKLKENFFDSDEMVLLESMPDGYLYSNILLKMYLKSLKFNGNLMVMGRIPYSPQMLATVLRHPVGVVEKALDIFKELELISVLDSGAIYMRDIQNFVGKSSTDGDRKREQRKALKSADETNVRTNVRQTTTRDRDRDRVRDTTRDRDITRDRDKGLLVQSCETASAPAPAEPAVYTLPCIKNEVYAVTQSQIDSWAEAYPAVDIDLAIKQMVAWLDANPDRRKTRKGCARFINTWLGREQDSGKTPRRKGGESSAAALFEGYKTI